jgi:hypothetical protein
MNKTSGAITVSQPQKDFFEQNGCLQIEGPISQEVTRYFSDVYDMFLSDLTSAPTATRRAGPF